MACMPDVTATTVLDVTPAAQATVLEVRAGEADPEIQALWVAIDGEANGAFTYDMYFRALDDAGDGDVIERHGDLPVVIVAESVENLRGGTLDVGAGGMVMHNPNRPAPPAPMPVADLSGPLALAVLAVLEEQINQSIAAHGGWAELVAVEDDVAYLRLQGGCQGCGLAAVTLSQGIEVAIFEHVPEITRVIDVTDHASGSNPYYEAAKK